MEIAPKMKKLCVSILAVAALGLTVLPSAAVTVSTDSLGDNPTSSTGNFSTSAAGDFIYYVTFSVSGGTSFTATAAAINAVLPDQSNIINPWSIALYSGTPSSQGGFSIGPNSATFVPTGCNLGSPTTCTSEEAYLSGVLPTAGNYFLEFQGTGGPGAGFGGTLATADPPPVPLPGAVSLFATGLVGLGLLGRRKHKAQS